MVDHDSKLAKRLEGIKAAASEAVAEAVEDIEPRVEALSQAEILALLSKVLGGTAKKPSITNLKKSLEAYVDSRVRRQLTQLTDSVTTLLGNLQPSLRSEVARTSPGAVQCHVAPAALQVQGLPSQPVQYYQSAPTWQQPQQAQYYPRPLGVPGPPSGYPFREPMPPMSTPPVSQHNALLAALNTFASELQGL